MEAYSLKLNSSWHRLNKVLKHSWSVLRCWHHVVTADLLAAHP